MGNLHGLFYSVGAIAGITAAALCLAVMAACILGMNLTA